MKLAILGTDSDIVDLAAAARNANHEIVWLGDVRPQDTAAIAPFTTGLADRAGQWELLLDRAISDAVLVGRGTAPGELHAADHQAHRHRRRATAGRAPRVRFRAAVLRNRYDAARIGRRRATF